MKLTALAECGAALKFYEHFLFGNCKILTGEHFSYSSLRASTLNISKFLVSSTDWSSGEHGPVHRQLSVSSDSKLLDDDIREETRVIMRPKKPPRPKSEVFLNKHEVHPRRKRFSAFGVSLARDFGVLKFLILIEMEKVLFAQLAGCLCKHLHVHCEQLEINHWTTKLCLRILRKFLLSKFVVFNWKC